MGGVRVVSNWFPPLQGVVETFGTVAGTSNCTSVQAGTSPASKGAWVTIANSTTFDWTGFMLAMTQSVAMNGVIDVAVGTAGNEVVIASDIHFNTLKATGIGKQYYIPVRVPKNARVSARTATMSGSLVPRIAITGVQGAYGFIGFSRAYGHIVSSAAGTAANILPVQLSTPGATNTKGSWTIIGSAQANYNAFLAIWSSGTDIAIANMTMLVDIGKGPTASAQAIATDLPVSGDSTSDLYFPLYSGPFVCKIQSGDQIISRFQASSVADPLLVQVVGLVP